MRNTSYKPAELAVLLLGASAAVIGVVASLLR